MSEDLDQLRKDIAALSASVAHLHEKKPVPLFADYAGAYLASKLLRPSLRASTKVGFENQVTKHLIPRFGALPLDKIGPAVWLQWIADEKGITRFFNARKVMTEILIAAKADGFLERLPKLENPDVASNVGRALSREEVLSILWRARRPHRFMFYCMWLMGCRPREILRWEWNMINFNADPVDIAIPERITKTVRARVIPLNPDVARYLRVIRKRRGDSPYVFTARNGPTIRPQLSYHSAWSTACRRAKVSNATAYDFRRTFVTKRASEGHQLLHIAKYLDTSIAMLEKIYAKRDAVALGGVAGVKK